VDISVDIVGAVELDHPIDSREIETSSGNICADEQGGFGGREFVKSVESGRLFLFAVQVE
jgi:hypothetical protein